MTNEERLNLRARQILDDPTLSQNQRVINAGALLRQLAESVRQNPAQLDSILGEISDLTVREQMRVALS